MWAPRSIRAGVMLLLALLLSGSECKKGSGGGGGSGSSSSGGSPGCTKTNDDIDVQLPDEDFPQAMVIPDPSCISMGRMYVAGQRVTGTVSYDDAVMCGNFNSSRLAIRNLRVSGELRFGFRYEPSSFPVMAHCAPTIAIIAALKPVVTFRVSGDVELQPGQYWTTATNVSVPHYEISRSDLTITKLDVAHVDPFADLVRDMVRSRLLDGIDKTIAERADAATCFCNETAPKGNAYPLYAAGYDPR